MINPRNLLIVRTDRIGDVVLSLPLAKLIKTKYPECRVTFLLREYTKPLAENNSYIDEIIVLKEKNGKLLYKDNIKQIGDKHFDSSIIVYPTFAAALIIYLSRITKRVGTGYRWYSLLFNERVFEHRKSAQKHELEYNIQLLEKFGIKEKPAPGRIDFSIKPNPEIEKNINRLLETKRAGIQNSPVIIFHPGSGGSAVDLPVDKFKELVNLTSEKLNAEIWLTGSKTESELCDEIAGNSRAQNFAGLFNLSELIALISKCDIFIANSTGPLHIAAALGKYTIGFYPKILACSPTRWAPYTDKRSIFLPKIKCENCTREQCAQLDCMNSIDIEEVFQNISEICKSFSNEDGEKNVK